MKILYNRATLHLLPPPGTRWQWGDIVGKTDDVKVDPKDAHAVKSMLFRHDDGTYETTRRLQEYLREKHGINLTGAAGGGAEQATLPGINGRGLRSLGFATDGSRPASPFDTGSCRQVTLDGSDATDRLNRVNAREARESSREAADQDHSSKHERARQDAGQAVLVAYRSRVRVGRFIRPTGGVYDGGRRVTGDC